MRVHLLGLCLVFAVVDCGLNPQPLPPDAPSDGGVTIATPTVGDDSGAHFSGDAGKQSGGSAPDAGTIGAFDGTAEPPPGADGGLPADASEGAVDGGHNAGDAAADAPLDAGPHDGSASDGPEGDAAVPVDAHTTDAAGDSAI